MAKKRMFSLDVIDTDNFLEMPISSRLLYYELGMRADDDGFVSNVKKILLFSGLKEDDLRILISKKFIIPFESGVIVITHWKQNNYIQSDRYKKTVYQDEMSLLTSDTNDVYTLYTECKHSIDKSRLDKSRLDKSSIYVEQKHDEIPYEEIINYLNEQTNSHYKHTTPKTKTFIKARWNEGFRLEDFKIVISKKTTTWLKDTKMKQYLRPETLFGTKFESYLNEQVKVTTNNIKNASTAIETFF